MSQIGSNSPTSVVLVYTNVKLFWTAFRAPTQHQKSCTGLMPPHWQLGFQQQKSIAPLQSLFQSGRNILHDFQALQLVTVSKKPLLAIGLLLAWETAFVALMWPWKECGWVIAECSSLPKSAELWEAAGFLTHQQRGRTAPDPSTDHTNKCYHGPSTGKCSCELWILFFASSL